jgi:FkbM family methyltransferase
MFVEPVARWLARRQISDRIRTRGIILDVGDINFSKELKIKLVRDTYEADEAAAIDTYLNPDIDLIDLGGCIGFTACYANNILTDGSKHIVVEPNKNLIPTLEHNRDLNGCDYDVLNAAYSTEGDTVTLNIPSNVWGASLNGGGTESIEADTVDLATILSTCALDKFVLIVDIEGAEAELISSELDLLESKCDLLIIEMHDQKEEYSEIRDDIRDAKRQLEESHFELVNDGSREIDVYRNTS